MLHGLWAAVVSSPAGTIGVNGVVYYCSIITDVRLDPLAVNVGGKQNPSSCVAYEIVLALGHLSQSLDHAMQVTLIGGFNTSASRRRYALPM